MIKLLVVRIVVLTGLFLMLFSCSEPKSKQEYFGDLGEIPFDDQLDDPNFKVCHEDITFPFNYGGVGFVYKGEKKALVNTVEKEYSLPERSGQTGYITIRFIINCQGKSGRFRVIETDLNLKKSRFESEIPQKLLDITKNLDGWSAFERNGKTWDYQQYLTFKLEDGQLTEILP